MVLGGGKQRKEVLINLIHRGASKMLAFLFSIKYLHILAVT